MARGGSRAVFFLQLSSYTAAYESQIMTLQARYRDLACHLGDGAILTGHRGARHCGDWILNFELCC